MFRLMKVKNTCVLKNKSINRLFRRHWCLAHQLSLVCLYILKTKTWITTKLPIVFKNPISMILYLRAYIKKAFLAIMFDTIFTAEKKNLHSSEYTFNYWHCFIFFAWLIVLYVNTIFYCFVVNQVFFKIKGLTFIS